MCKMKIISKRMNKINTKDIVDKLKSKVVYEIENFNIFKFFKLTLMLTVIALVLYALSEVTNAGVKEIMDSIGSPESFDKLSGSKTKFLSEKFRGNYHLDASFGAFDWWDKTVNFIANLCFDGVTIITYLMIVAFSFAFGTNLSDIFGGVVDNIMKSLKNGIFDSYFGLVVVISMIFVIVSMARKNMSEFISRFSYIIIATTLAIFIASNASKLISVTTNMSKSIGTSAVLSIASSGKSEAYDLDNKISEVSGELWYNLVHEPWKTLEAENKLSDKEYEQILSLDIDSEERQKIIDNHNSNDKTLFSDTAGGDRILPSIFLIGINGFKTGIMTIIALVQLVFQIFTFVLIFLTPFILLVSMVPSFGGINMVKNFGMQIVGSQFGIVVISFFLGVIIQVDSLIATTIKSITNSSYGWMFISFIQALIFLGIIMMRKQIFKLIMDIQKKVHSSGNGVWRKASQYSDKMAEKGGEKAKETVSNVRERTRKGVEKGAHVVASGILSADDKVRRTLNNFKEKKNRESNKNNEEESFSNSNNQRKASDEYINIVNKNNKNNKSEDDGDGIKKKKESVNLNERIKKKAEEKDRVVVMNDKIPSKNNKDNYVKKEEVSKDESNAKIVKEKKNNGKNSINEGIDKLNKKSSIKDNTQDKKKENVNLSERIKEKNAKEKDRVAVMYDKIPGENNKDNYVKKEEVEKENIDEKVNREENDKININERLNKVNNKATISNKQGGKNEDVVKRSNSNKRKYIIKNMDKVKKEQNKISPIKRDLDKKNDKGEISKMDRVRMFKANKR